MTDRAVVDTHRVECPECHQWTVPRALVAISEDRQWLVVDQGDVWTIYRDRINGFGVWGDIVGDDGGDAHDVLKEFLNGQ